MFFLYVKQELGILQNRRSLKKAGLNSPSDFAHIIRCAAQSLQHAVCLFVQSASDSSPRGPESLRCNYVAQMSVVQS